MRLPLYANIDRLPAGELVIVDVVVSITVVGCAPFPARCTRKLRSAGRTLRPRREWNYDDHDDKKSLDDEAGAAGITPRPGAGTRQPDGPVSQPRAVVRRENDQCRLGGNTGYRRYIGRGASVASPQWASCPPSSPTTSSVTTTRTRGWVRLPAARFAQRGQRATDCDVCLLRRRLVVVSSVVSTNFDVK
jgi:hypothetical protein